jgi:hydrocephalus-inducing protein
MEDSRRPFTPMIQPTSPTPENSASPRGRKGKGGFDSSPSRKANGGKDASKDKKDKDGKTSQAAAKKGPPAKETPTEIEQSKSRGGPSRKGKAQDKSDLDESISYNKKSSDLMEASFKMNPNDLSDMATSRTIDEGQTGRPESQMMRAESSLSHHAPSSISETGYIPFNVEPNFGKLEPGKSQSFKVKFAPLNVNDYQARISCHIPNSEDGKIGHMIAVKGRGLLPYCHMELEESDYITAGRRDPDLPGPAGAASGLGLDPNTKVIEFNCIGLETKANKIFEIINPTNTDYDFEWIKEDQNDAKKHDQFTCLVQNGTLHSGKKFDIEFEFEPNSLESQESFWRFRIPKYDLTIPFLLVGNVSEPKVLFERSHISFKSLLIGKQGRESVSLINQENKQLTFEFDQTSCYTEGRSAVIILEPSSGILEPNSKLNITLTFQPREQRSHIFNLKCKVSHLSKPLNLNVKGEGFQMQTSLYCEDTYSGNKIEFVDNSINEIHMGEVEKNETSFRNLFIFNSGKHTANFEWVLSSQYEDALSCFSIEPLIDQVEPGDKKHCILKYKAKYERSTIANMILKIENGSVYHVHLDGIGVRPDLHLSFSNYDFGPCFIYKAGMKLKQADLQLINRGNKDLNISCLNSDISNKNSCFQFEFKQTILQPGKSINTQISFIPRECRAYSEQIILELNGLTRREIFLTGIGAQLKLELVDSKQKCFDIGTLQVDKQVQKKLQIINRSTAPIDFNLLFEPRSEYLNKDKNVLKIEPFQNLSLRAGQTQDLTIKFSPKYRIPKFVEDLNVEYNGINLPLCSLQGACHGYNIWLDMYHIPFGAVSQKCSTIKRLVMHNDGDIGASFKWDLEKMKPEFSIYPVNGYISPSMEVNFDITYNPTELTSDLRKENIKCFIEGMQPILLTLTGSCVQIIAQKETHNFDTFVRQKDSKQITISNRSNIPWEIKPLIEGDYYSGLESFTVECQSTSSFEIVYFPMTMTQTNGPKHTGSIFFPLPDGTGILYNLSGTANPPKPIGKIVREVPCKNAFIEILPVENWLKKPQRFKVIFEIIKPEKPDPSTTIKGNEYIDVPGNGKKDFKMNYYAHKENLTLFKVVFKNEQTNEYCFYEMSFKSLKGTSIGTIDLTTQVRIPVSHSIKLENPLANMITFNASCSNNTEVLIPSSLSIIGKGQVIYL